MSEHQHASFRDRDACQDCAAARALAIASHEHDYEVICRACGQRGTVTLSIEPRTLHDAYCQMNGPDRPDVIRVCNCGKFSPPTR